jgi:hypothetical protein
MVSRGLVTTLAVIIITIRYSVDTLLLYTGDTHE